MAGYLPKEPASFPRIEGAKIAIIASMWHWDCVERMIKRAITELETIGCKDIELHRLPGSYELPLAARIIFEKKDAPDAIIAFGVVLKGGTTHDEMILQEIVSGFSQVMHDHRKPIINEVIGVTTIEDAVKRSSDGNWNKGLEAAFAAAEYLNWRKTIG